MERRGGVFSSSLLLASSLLSPEDAAAIAELAAKARLAASADASSAQQLIQTVLAWQEKLLFFSSSLLLFFFSSSLLFFSSSLLLFFSSSLLLFLPAPLLPFSDHPGELPQSSPDIPRIYLGYISDISPAHPLPNPPKKHMVRENLFSFLILFT